MFLEGSGMNDRINMGRRLLIVALMPTLALMVLVGAMWQPMQALLAGATALPLIVSAVLVIATVAFAITTLRGFPVDRVLRLFSMVFCRRFGLALRLTRCCVSRSISAKPQSWALSELVALAWNC